MYGGCLHVNIMSKGLRMDGKRRQVILELVEQLKKRILERRRIEEKEKRLKSFSVQSAEFQTILTVAKKAVDKLKRKLESEDWLYLAADLPRLNNLEEDEARSINIIPDNVEELIHFMITSMEQKNTLAFSGYTKKLVAYEMMFGFWDDSQKVELEEQLISIKEVNDHSRRVLEDMSRGNAEVRMMIDRINSERRGLEELKSVVALKVNDADNKNAQFAESIKRYQEDGDKLLKEFNQRTNVVANQLENAQTLMAQIEEKLAKTNQLSEEKLKSVDDNLAESKSKVEEIKKLMGFVGGSVLGNSFNERKKSLTKKAVFWLVVSLIFLIGAIVWICIVFTSLSAHTEIVWADILINVVKSSLAVFAFGYALNEYGKERNLQEEYAFRESVALTLTAYLDQLGACNEAEKKKLLVDTVEKLYTKPVISTKEYKMVQLDTKEIAEIVKPITEAIKPLTGK